MTAQWGATIAGFVAIIGVYAFTFKAYRTINNHLADRLKRIDKKLDQLGERTARIEGYLNRGRG